MNTWEIIILSTILNQIRNLYKMFKIIKLANKNACFDSKKKNK